MVRGFATYLQAIDPRCEIPARELLREDRRRVPPHIYSADEIASLMRHGRDLRPPFRAMTIETAIGLLAVTGMRSGEVVRLDRDHIDLAAGRIRIVATKFNKSRELALHPTAVEALDTYCRERDRLWPPASHVEVLPVQSGQRAESEQPRAHLCAAGERDRAGATAGITNTAPKAARSEA